MRRAGQKQTLAEGSPLGGSPQGRLVSLAQCLEARRAQTTGKVGSTPCPPSLSSPRRGPCGTVGGALEFNPACPRVEVGVGGRPEEAGQSRPTQPHPHGEQPARPAGPDPGALSRHVPENSLDGK